MSSTPPEGTAPAVDDGRLDPTPRVGPVRRWGRDRQAWGNAHRAAYRLLTRGRNRLRSPRRELLVFVLVAAVVLVAVSTATIVLSSRIASQTALSEAERATSRLARFVVAPLLTDARAGVPGAAAELQDMIENRMTDGSLTEIDIWAADGLIVYSSNPGVGGTRHTPPEEVRAAIEDGVTSSGLEETREADPQGSSDVELELYVPLQIDGERYAFEAYYDSGAVARQSALLRWQIIPVAVGALLLLQLVQIPIARRLAFRVAQHEAARSRLLARTMDASERERRTIAGDVHDGPVQELAGVAYALSAVQLTATPDQQRVLARLQESVRSAVGQLRRLMVDIYPPDLSGPGLAVAIADLADGLRSRGVQVDVRARPPQQLRPDVAATLYRVVREALSNVEQHAAAGRVLVELGEVPQRGRPAVHLSVTDDGVGLPPHGIERRSEGHLGLRLLVDRVEDLGGAMTFEVPPGGGTSIVVTLPADAEA